MRIPVKYTLPDVVGGRSPEIGLYKAPLPATLQPNTNTR